MDFLFESQRGHSIHNPPNEMVDRLLTELDGMGNSYASLTARDGGYIQAGGGPREFTVEQRTMGENGGFSHVKAAILDGDRNERRLTIGGARVAVRDDQVLNLAQVQSLFRAYRQHANLPDIQWEDITSMFVNE